MVFIKKTSTPRSRSALSHATRLALLRPWLNSAIIALKRENVVGRAARHEITGDHGLLIHPFRFMQISATVKARIKDREKEKRSQKRRNQLILIHIMLTNIKRRCKPPQSAKLTRGRALTLLSHLVNFQTVQMVSFKRSNM